MYRGARLFLIYHPSLDYCMLYVYMYYNLMYLPQIIAIPGLNQHTQSGTITSCTYNNQVQNLLEFTESSLFESSDVFSPCQTNPEPESCSLNPIKINNLILGKWYQNKDTHGSQCKVLPICQRFKPSFGGWMTGGLGMEGGEEGGGRFSTVYARCSLSK